MSAQQFALPAEFKFFLELRQEDGKPRQPTKRQAAELARLCDRWKLLVSEERITGNCVTGNPGEQSISAARKALVDDFVAFGRKHGFIADAPPGLPSEPLAAVHQAIRYDRTALRLMRTGAFDWQGIVNDLWNLWRDQLPENPLPASPTVSNWEQVQSALDLAQRKLISLQRSQRHPAVSKWADLARFAENSLKGNERKLVEAVIDGDGRVPIARLAQEMRPPWETPWDDAFNSTKNRVNDKLKAGKLPYRIRRQNSEAHAYRIGG